MLRSGPLVKCGHAFGPYSGVMQWNAADTSEPGEARHRRYRSAGCAVSGKPRVWLRAEPFRDFLADADLVERICRDDFEDEEQRRWRVSSSDDLGDGPFRGQEDWNDDGFQRLAEFERQRSSVVRRLSND